MRFIMELVAIYLLKDTQLTSPGATVTGVTSMQFQADGEVDIPVEIKVSGTATTARANIRSSQ